MNGKLRINFRVGVISLDVALIHVAMLIAYLLRYRLQWFLDVAFEAPFRAYLPFSLLLSGVIPLLLWVNGAYSRWRGRSWLEHVYYIVNAVAEAAVLTLALAFVVRPLVYSRLLLLEAVLGIAVLLSLDRAYESPASSWGGHQTGVNCRRWGGGAAGDADNCRTARLRL